MTNRCNLRCSYCWENIHQYKPLKTLEIDFAKQGLLDFYQQTGSNYLGFTGGEATLSVNSMDEIISYARKLIGQVKTELQTNGFFNKDVRQWVYENMDIVWISSDGPADIHDLNRLTESGTGSSHIVVNNLKGLIAQQSREEKEITIGVRSTISSHSVKRQKELVDYYHALGVRVMFVSPLFKPVGATTPLAGAVDYLLFGEQFLEAHLYAKSLGMFYGTFAMANFDEPVPVACRALLPNPHLMPGGFVSACEMCYEEGSDLDIFIYGKWKREQGLIAYDPGKIALLQSRTIANLEGECKSCPFLENCAGGCAGEVFSETGSLFRREPERCKLTQYLAERMERNAGLYPYFHS